MAIFTLGKSFDDIEEPQLLPEDWYVMEISDEPKQAANKTKKDHGPDAENAGDNIVLRLRTVHEDPEYNNRPITVWLSLPNPTDEGEYVNGQPKEDWKLEQIAKVTAAFNGMSDWKEMQGDEVELSKGMRAKFYITQGIGMDGQTAQNQINLLSTPPMPIG